VRKWCIRLKIGVPVLGVSGMGNGTEIKGLWTDDLLTTPKDMFSCAINGIGSDE
jgi:hypothetical protein